MQRSHAAKVLRALHRLKDSRGGSLKGAAAEYHSRLLANEGGEGTSEGAQADEEVRVDYQRQSSKEWADSFLQWGGTSPLGVVGAGDNGVAEYDDESSANLSQKYLKKGESNLRGRFEASKRKWRWSQACDLRSDLVAAKKMILGNWVNVLLLTIPFAFASHLCGWSPFLVFSMNLCGIIPLALILGEVTEDLALRFGDLLGGLINATFGNVVEMILSIVLLRKGLYTVVSASLVGSVLSNLLLVLGFCFFVGGLYYKQQNFSSGASKANTSLLFMTCIAMILPTMMYEFDGSSSDDEQKILNMSHAIAVVLTVIYCLYLYFQLVTHHHIFDSRGQGEDHIDIEENEEEPTYSGGCALFIMTLTTAIVAFQSEFLSDSIEEVSSRSGMSLNFIGIIILPIAGNACEHITAVMVAAKNKMDLALSVAVGSSIQIAIFVYPFVCLVGWGMKADFSLKLNNFDMVVLSISVILVALITIDGQSHWFTGLMLITTYVLIAMAYFF